MPRDIPSFPLNTNIFSEDKEVTNKRNSKTKEDLFKTPVPVQTVASVRNTLDWPRGGMQDGGWV